jgi:mannosyl-3-phosphoglycerate phosphatase
LTLAVKPGYGEINMRRNASKPKPEKERIIIFTDLDGTLLDYYTYSCEVVKPLIEKLKGAGVEIVPCSSKTRVEIEVYRKRLGLETPFIVENGSAIFIGRGYFNFPYDYRRTIGKYRVIELGIAYEEVRRKLDTIRQECNLSFRGFGDMDDAQVAALTGLDMASARRARRREYSETLEISGSEKDIKQILDKIKDAGLNWSRGSRLYSVAGVSDKGIAVKILAGLYKKKMGRIKTIGVGDSPNDEPMLAAVDLPVLVQKPGGFWEDIELPNLYKAKGIGPEGWVKVIKKLTGIG